ncbi:hypothetical protein C3489_28885 [Streptomyces sp. Ru71]|nr:hypothetical protein C3489_28885 [Streptomyces sp. Ru71]
MFLPARRVSCSTCVIEGNGGDDTLTAVGDSVVVVGDHPIHGNDDTHFYTRGNVVTTRWPDPSKAPGGRGPGLPPQPLTHDRHGWTDRRIRPGCFAPPSGCTASPRRCWPRPAGASVCTDDRADRKAEG